MHHLFYFKEKEQCSFPGICLHRNIKLTFDSEETEGRGMTWKEEKIERKISHLLTILIYSNCYSKEVTQWIPHHQTLAQLK